MITSLFLFGVLLISISSLPYCKSTFIRLKALDINTEKHISFHEHAHHPSTHLKHLSKAELRSSNTLQGFIAYFNSLEGPIELSKFDIHSFQFISSSSFLFHSSYSQAEIVQKHPSVKWVGFYTPNMKLKNSPSSDDSEGTISFESLSSNENFLEKCTSIIELRRGDLDFEKIIAETTDEISRGGVILSEYGLKLKRAGRRKLVLFSVKECDSGVMTKVLHILTHNENILFIDDKPESDLFTLSASWLLQSGITNDIELQETPFISSKYNLTGKGQIVGVADSGIDLEHCDFLEDNKDSFPDYPFYEWSNNYDDLVIFNDSDSNRSKVIQYVSYMDSIDNNGHGTFVSGAIAGKVNGLATEAKISFFDIRGTYFSVPIDLYSMFSSSLRAGAYVHSNSWGFTSDSSYNSYVQDVDEFMFDNKNFLIIFSAGNFGTCNTKSTVRAPAVCKNCIAVGASHSSYSYWKNNQENSKLVPFAWHLFQIDAHENLAYFSSLGPTADGRTKPDLVAPGLFVTSSKKGTECETTTMDGTSSAAPLIAGISVIIRQYFTDGYYPSGSPNESDQLEPTAALLKAMLLHSTMHLKGSKMSGKLYKYQDNSCSDINVQKIPEESPNNWEGWGLPQIDSVLFFKGETEFSLAVHEGIISTGESVKYEICAQINSTIKATLVWTDPPSYPGAIDVLVNNLDLFAFISETKVASSESTFNTVEKIEVNMVIYEGQLSISVYGAKVPDGPQDYSLVLTGKFLSGHCSTKGGNSDSEWVFQPPLDEVLRSSVHGLLDSKLYEDFSIWAVNSTWLDDTLVQKRIFSGSNVYVKRSSISVLHTCNLQTYNVTEFSVISYGDILGADSSSTTLGLVSRGVISGITIGETCVSYENGIPMKVSEFDFLGKLDTFWSMRDLLQEEAMGMNRFSAKVCRTCASSYSVVYSGLIVENGFSQEFLSSVQTFEIYLTNKDVSASSWIMFPEQFLERWNECDESLIVIINISGDVYISDLTLPILELSDCISKSLVWNINNVGRVVIGSEKVAGSILAPESDIETSGIHTGKIIANNIVFTRATVI